MAHLYQSRDFMKWTKAQHPLHSSAMTGMWECPDFYLVSLDCENGLETSVMTGNIKHVLKVSLDETRYEYYTIGTYFPKKDSYVPDNTSLDGRAGLRYDYGNFYASKTFFDASRNRRILWGWVNESDASNEDVKKGWAGIQIWMPNNFVATRVQMFKVGSSLEKNKLWYKPSFAGFVDVDLADNKLSLRSLIDHSIVESFGARGKTCITSRVYPTLAVLKNAHLYAFNNGSETIIIESLNAWSMGNPLMN
ncbi:hypothetical protein HYC85_006796 [Camellia sinensis]|uniref:Glycosyl hydrolase family 32 N-terminal domain-containing protein n=1 Tax=Camellia sinensis TaxID=4442 RepID=A0A7J7HM37_CAMSI|nr:hypothetical protein HYC85_006796 [Camellia sinensis]